MRLSEFLSLAVIGTAQALSHQGEVQVPIIDQTPTIIEPNKYLIEVAPGKTQWVTEVCLSDCEKCMYTNMQCCRKRNGN
jgi:hypothetical protein